MLTQDELLNLFTADESDRVERTQAGKDRDKIGKAITAFANDLPNHQKPGVLFIGQQDNSECAHLTIDDELLKNISNFATDINIMPPPVVTVQKHTLNNCTVCVVTVAPSTSPPVRYQGACWVRVGPTQKRATPQEETILAEKNLSHHLPFVAQEVVPAVPFSELNIDFFRKEYLPQAISPQTLAENQRDDIHQLKSLRFLSRNDKPNFASVLCFHYSPLDIVPGAYIQFLRIQGEDLVDSPISSKAEITGNIFEQMRTIDEYFKANIEIGVRFGNDKRTDTPNYPLVALQEIIRNALVHRSYENTNAPIRCYWFSDRIEIQSPGGVYGQIRKDNFTAKYPKADYRNAALAEAITTMGYAERFGVGIIKAKNAMRKNGNPDIDFEVTELFVSATLKPITK